MDTSQRITISALCCALLLQGCTTPSVLAPEDRSAHFTLRALERDVSPSPSPQELDQQQEEEGATQITRVRPLTLSDGIVPAQAPITQLDVRAGEPLRLDTTPNISLEINNLPLPAFINEVAGEHLGFNFTLAPNLARRNDLVSLRISQPISAQDLYRTFRNLLADYGVAIEQDAQGDQPLLRFVLSADAATGDVPLLISGRALPEVPISHRPVYQVVELSVVGNAQVRAPIQQMFRGQTLEVREDPQRNAVILVGAARVVQQAVEAIRFFDQPTLRGREIAVIEPATLSVNDLGQALEQTLRQQGYAVGTTGNAQSLVLLRLNAMNKLIVFAADQHTLEHAVEWARLLDRREEVSIENGTFVYNVRNTRAEHLLNLARNLAGEDSPTSRRMVLDANRNVLIFRGSGREWQELRRLLVQLDQPVPSVLIEILLAEVSLNDESGLGVEWLARQGIGSLDGTIGTLGNLGLGSSGLTYTLNNAGQTRAALNAFFTSQQAVIRSSPRLMVKSGEQATLEVGNEIPVITQRRQGDSQTDGNTDVIQQFQYRRTGVNLSITPIVQASGLVDIQIEQSLSEATDTGASGANFTPTILNRRVNTSLTLRDGGSVVLGGMISTTRSRGRTGVPILGQIPLIGRLFTVEKESENTTELLVMVIPYVVHDQEQAESLTLSLQRQLIQQQAEALDIQAE